MWWAGNSVIDVYVSSARAGASGRQLVPSWRQGTDPVQTLQALLRSAELRRSRRAVMPSARLWLACELARPFVVMVPRGLHSDRELDRLIAARAGGATGLTEPCSIRCEGSRRQHCVLAVASRGPLVAALQRTVLQAGYRLLAMRPWWSVALDDALAASGRVPARIDLLAVEEPSGFTLLECDAAGEWLDATSGLALANRDDLFRLISRRRLVNGSAAVAALALDDATSNVAGRRWPATQRIALPEMP